MRQFNGTGTAKEWEDILSAAEPPMELSLVPDGYGPSDHSAFYEAGVPVLHFFTGAHEDYHKPTDDIEKVSARGIHTADGGFRELDTIIYSTGFYTTRYLATLQVHGRGGRSIEEAWDDGAQAYLGMSTAGFPNLFMLYGPNTNQGCILFMLERQVDYVMRQISRMDDENLAWMDIRPEVMDRFNDQIQKDIDEVDVWQANCGHDFYYRAGPNRRFVTQWPHSMDDFTAATTAPDADTFEVKKSA